MKTIKLLNLYAGIGGNRKGFEIAAKKHNVKLNVTAIENDVQRADEYQRHFPNDIVIVDDAHQYLLDHFKEFSFIWASPPCQSHSTANNFLHYQGYVRYKDAKLYQEIDFLQSWYDGYWVVENVKPYGKPWLKENAILNRHYYWSNFLHGGKFKTSAYNTINANSKSRNMDSQNVAMLQKNYNFYLTEEFKGDKRKALRNCVAPQDAAIIFGIYLQQKQGLEEFF